MEVPKRAKVRVLRENMAKLLGLQRQEELLFVDMAERANKVGKAQAVRSMQSCHALSRGCQGMSRTEPLLPP